MGQAGRALAAQLRRKKELRHAPGPQLAPRAIIIITSCDAVVAVSHDGASIHPSHPLTVTSSSRRAGVHGRSRAAAGAEGVGRCGHVSSASKLPSCLVVSRPWSSVLHCFFHLVRRLASSFDCHPPCPRRAAASRCAAAATNSSLSGRDSLQPRSGSGCCCCCWFWLLHQSRRCCWQSIGISLLGDGHAAAERHDCY